MKLSEIIALRCTDNEKLDKILAALTKIKPFEGKNPDDITVEMLEKVQRKLDVKTNVSIGYIVHTRPTAYGHKNEQDYWNACMINHASGEHKMATTIYGLSILELFSKVVLYQWGWLLKQRKKGNAHE